MIHAQQKKPLTAEHVHAMFDHCIDSVKVKYNEQWFNCLRSSFKSIREHKGWTLSHTEWEYQDSLRGVENKILLQAFDLLKVRLKRFLHTEDDNMIIPTLKRVGLTQRGGSEVTTGTLRFGMTYLNHQVWSHEQEQLYTDTEMTDHLDWQEQAQKQAEEESLGYPEVLDEHWDRYSLYDSGDHDQDRIENYAPMLMSRTEWLEQEHHEHVDREECTPIYHLDGKVEYVGEKK